MPDYWFNMGAAKKFAEENELDVDYITSICIDKKPYFMTYVYDDYRKKYTTYLKDSDISCKKNFNVTISELESYEHRTEEQEIFLQWYYKKMPFGMGNCAMNKICYYIENQFDNYKANLKANSSFDYNTLKVKRRCTEEHRKALIDLSKEYIEMIAEHKSIKARNTKYNLSNNIMTIDEDDLENGDINIQEYFYNKAKEICPNDDERLNIILDISYGYKGNKQFCWNVIGDLICKRLECMKNNEE